MSARYSLPREFSPPHQTGIRPSAAAFSQATTAGSISSIFTNPAALGLSSPPPYSSAYEEGISHCDATVQSFHKVLLDTNDLRGRAVEYFSAQERALSKHLVCLERLQQNILEEKRAVESQHQECMVQLEQFAKRQDVVAEESDELVDFLTVDMAHLEADDESLDARHGAVEERSADMDNLMKDIDARLSEIAATARKLQAESDQLANKTGHLNRRRDMLKRADVNLEQKQKDFKRREKDIDVYTRSLEIREAETARVQHQLIQAFKIVEHEEQKLGVDVASIQKRSAANNEPVLTLRVLMDNHDMSIERETDHEELDIDVENDDCLSDD